jgi:hypothetical protein
MHENPSKAVAKENFCSCMREKYRKGRKDTQATKSKYIHLNLFFMN